MPKYLTDLIKKAKRIKTEEDEIHPKQEKKEVREEEVKKVMLPAKKEKERKSLELQRELEKKVPGKKQKEEPEEEKQKTETIVSSVDLELESMDKKEIDSYGEVKIYKVPGKVLLYYVVPVSKPTLGERTIINTIKEAATRLISIAPYKIRDPEQRRTVYKQKIIEILRASTEMNIPERRFNFYAESVVREMVGYGLIDSLVRDDQLEEIMVIGSKKPVYVFHRKHEMMVTNIEFFSDSEIIDLINRIAREVGRRVDMSAPLLDARLPNGSRVNATIPPASISGSSLTIRKFREDPYSIIDLINYGTFDVKSAAFLWLCVDGLGVKPANVLITGGTGSGKTTTLNVLASFIPERERIVTIEDSVDAEEEIIVFRDGKPQKVKIGELVDKKIQENGCNYFYSGHESCLNFEDIETFCFDEKGKISKKPIHSFIRHKTNKKMYEIVFRSGRKVKVTEDHSLFSLNEKAEISPIKTSELKEGSFLAAPRELPFESKGLKEIDLFEHLEKLKKCFILGKPVEKELKKIDRKTLEKHSAGKTKNGRKCSANAWKRTGIIRTELLDELHKNGLIELKDKENIFLKPKVNSRKIPLSIKLDEVFLEFIGFWIADGCYDKNSVILSTDDKEVESIIKEVAGRFNANVKMHSDKFSLMINSSMLKKIMQDVLGLTGKAFTKKMPAWMDELNNEQICWVLKGYFSGDGTIAKNEVEWTSCSEQLMKDIQTMLLRNGIMARTATKRYFKDKSFKGRISSYAQIKQFIEKISFIQEGKNSRALNVALKRQATHDSTDLIPLPASFLQSKKQELKLQHEYYSGNSRLGRRFLQKMVSFSESSELEMLAGTDIFWDQVKEIKLLPKKERFVYDLSVPGYENFVCSNVFVHNTAELNLPLKHIISLEARPPGLEGTGEITLDILTKNSLRMRPDRVIVGEVRHDEAFTLFTAMNTGHDGAVTGETLIQLSDGNILEIEKIVEKEFNEKEAVKEKDFEFIELGKKEIKVPSFNKQTLKIEDKKVTHVWRKKTKTKLKKIKLKSGKELHLTKDHPVYRISNGLQEINSEEAKAGDFIVVPAEIKVCTEKELIKPYLMGLIYGDGHLGREAIQFVNAEESLIESFKREITPLTENKVSQFDYNGFSRVQLCDKKLIQKIHQEYEMPIGNKTKTFRFTEKILSAKNNELALLIRGLHDSEAHVNLQANCIQFSTSNKDLARKLPLILLRFGISSSSYSQEKDGKGNFGPYYRISVYGKDNLEKFREKIGFEHKKKKEKLELLIEKSKQSLDLIPNTERLIKTARLENRMTQTELNVLLGTKTRSVVEAYETKKRNPSRKKLKEIINLLEGNTARQLKILAESDLKFEKIVSAEETEFEGFLYDLTVEDNHNYIANGMLISNCLGTIHANSPQETLVRVTSPPMNVPEVMLSGLDLVVVEHRIHDKKKGTIRRITEIAEVTGVLQNKTSTQTLFERDPIKDKLVKTNVESEYIKTLMKFTGYTAKQIEQELREREDVLEKLIDKKVNKMEDVVSAIHEHLEKK